MPSDAHAVCSYYVELPIVRAALDLLAGLPLSLTYHTRDHTLDVLREAIAFAVADNVSGRASELLSIGAAYHDLGFIEQRSRNEEIGARLAGEAMIRAGGYTAEEIVLVETMIRDTELKILPEGPRQVPTTELSKYLCDADVSNLGRPDFFEKAELVRRELELPRSEQTARNLRAFIGAHRWYTPAAEAARAEGKAANIAALDRLIRDRAW